MTATARCPLCVTALATLMLGMGLASWAVAQQRIGV
jgi:hypothetical protein